MASTVSTMNTNSDPPTTPEELSSAGSKDDDDSEAADVVTFGGDLANATSTSTRRRQPFVSRHRQELDRIRDDAAKNLSYPVPANDSDDDSDGERGSSHRRNAKTVCNKLGKACTNFVHSKSSGSDWLESILPMWSWLKVYPIKENLPKDLIAGLTVGVMIVPQSMSYAKLAGLPVEYGLYSALLPVYAYSLFGSSRQLAVGPVALISLLLSTGLTQIMASQGYATQDEGYQHVYNTLAIQTSFWVGIVNIGMGLARMGFVTIFLSHAVISGFTTGAAVIIGLSQVKYILGYDVARSKQFHYLLYNIFKDISQLNWKTFLMGMLSILLLVGMKYLGKTYKKFKWARATGPLTVTVVGIVLVYALNLQDRGIPIVGHIPQGLPAFTGNLWTAPTGANVNEMIVLVMSIVIVGFMESIAIAKQLASKHKYEIDSSLELVGLGMSNFCGAMFQSYPVTGSFSRSAVNNESGAQSGIAGVVTATLVAIVLLLLTPVFEKLPLCVLASIVISGVIGLLDYPEAMQLWRVHKFDFVVWLVACLGTMFLGVEIGLAIAVAVSLLLVIYESAYPHTAVLGRLPGTTVYRNVKQYPEAERYDGIVIVRVDAPLYFANAQNVRDKIRKYRKVAGDASNNDSAVKYVILEFSPVSHIDTSALHILEDMNRNYKSRGQQLCFANPSLRVMERLVLSGFVAQVGKQHFFSCSHDAVNWCLKEMDDVETIMQSSSGDEEKGGMSSLESSVNGDNEIVFVKEEAV